MREYQWVSLRTGLTTYGKCGGTMDGQCPADGFSIAASSCRSLTGTCVPSSHDHLLTFIIEVNAMCHFAEILRYYTANKVVELVCLW